MRVIFLGLLASLIQIITSQSRDLRFLFSIFRHGARAPENGVSKGVDMLGETWNSPGELTPVGMRMHFLLGTRNRAKYSSFVGTTYNPNNIYIRSSDFNRTMMSVQSQLQGWFPSGTGPVLTENQQAVAFPKIGQNWGTFQLSSIGANAIQSQVQTFPVHLFVERDTKFFFFYHSLFEVCPSLKDYFANNAKATEISTFMSTFKTNYGEKLRLALGKTDTKFLDDYHTLFVLFDTFIAGYFEDKKFTKLTAQGIDLQAFNQTAFEFAALDILKYYNGGAELYLPKFTVSAFLDEILFWMDKRIALDVSGDKGNYGYQSPRLALFSTHDVTLGSFLNYLKSVMGTNVYYTPFASSLFFELTSDPNTTITGEANYKVSINFNDNILVENMSYADFKAKMKSGYMTYDEIMAYCNDVPVFVQVAFRHATIGLAICLGVCFIVLILVLIICCCCYERKNGHTAVATNTENNKV